MQIKDLINCNYNINISDIYDNSSDVKEGGLYICIKGSKFDGHDYINDAIKNGASFIISENEIPIDFPHLIVKDTKETLKELIPIFYKINKNIKFIGITGTDGKTTTSLITKHLINNHYNTGYIGTNGVIFNNKTIKINNTTPNNLVLHRIINIMQQNDVNAIIMEVSSHAIKQNRIRHITFDFLIYTNLTHEHLDYHKTMHEYFMAKASIFINASKDTISIINIDDEYSSKLIQLTSSKILKYSIKEETDIFAFNIKSNIDNMYYEFRFNNNTYSINTNLTGQFNVKNSLAAILVAINLNIDIKTILKRLSNVEKIEGRQTKIINHHNINILVDFAHTPNSIENIIQETKKVTKGNTIVVLGSAGERDSSKRPLIGEKATKQADFVIFTDEDPKSEDPDKIINDLIDRVKKENYLIIRNREKAIKEAVSISRSEDSVIICGKGNEKTLVYNNYSIEHCDIEIAKKAIIEKNT